MDPNPKIHILPNVPTDKRAYMICMDGPVENGATVDTTAALCDDCLTEIYYDALSCPYEGILKICRACGWERMQSEGMEHGQFGVTEGAIQAAIKHYKYPDTQETRDMIMQQAERHYMRWLKEGYDLREATKRDPWTS